jgi:hypothetical protein
VFILLSSFIVVNIDKENTMSSPQHSWEQLSESEMAKIIEDIRSKPITFASSDRIQEHSEIADRFFELVLGCEETFISDESSLHDFFLIDTVANLEKKFKRFLE